MSKNYYQREASHKKSAILYWVFFHAFQRGIFIFDRYAIKAFNKSLDSGADIDQKIQRRSKNETVCLPDFRNQFVKGVFLDARLFIAAGIAAQTWLYFIFNKEITSV